MNLVCFTTGVPDRSNTNGTQMRHSATRVEHECYTQRTRVQHECYTNDTRATRVKDFDFDNDTSENIFFTPLY